jgi:hypothetical protein
MSQVTVNISNGGSVKLLVTVRDLKAGVVPPVLPSTWIEPQSPEIPLYVQAGDDGRGKIRWSAQNSAGVEIGAATVDVDDRAVVDVGK